MKTYNIATLEMASTGPRSIERGESSSVTPSGARPQYSNCDSLRYFDCLFARDVWFSRHYQLALMRLRHASASGCFRTTPPLAG